MIVCNIKLHKTNSGVLLASPRYRKESLLRRMNSRKAFHLVKAIWCCPRWALIWLTHHLTTCQLRFTHSRTRCKMQMLISGKDDLRRNPLVRGQTLTTVIAVAPLGQNVRSQLPQMMALTAKSLSLRKSSTHDQASFWLQTRARTLSALKKTSIRLWCLHRVLCSFQMPNQRRPQNALKWSIWPSIA